MSKMCILNHKKSVQIAITMGKVTKIDLCIQMSTQVNLQKDIIFLHSD